MCDVKTSSIVSNDHLILYFHPALHSLILLAQCSSFTAHNLTSHITCVSGHGKKTVTKKLVNTEKAILEHLTRTT